MKPKVIREQGTFINARSFVLMLGLATFWAYFDSCFFSLQIPRGLSDGLINMPLLRGIGLVTSAIPALFVAVFSHRAAGFLKNTRVFAALAALVALCTFMLFIPAIAGSATAYALVLFVAGIANGTLLFTWLKLYAEEDCREDRRSAGMLMAGSLALGGVMVLLVSLLKMQASFVVVALFPLLGAFLRIYFNRHFEQPSPQTDGYPCKPSAQNSTAQTRDVRDTLQGPQAASPFADPFATCIGISKRLFFAIVIFSIATGLVQYQLPTENLAEPAIPEQIYELSRYGTALIVLLGVLVLKWKPYIVFRAGMMFVIGAYMAMPFLPEQLRYLSVALINSGYTCLELMVWTVLFESARLGHTQALRVAGTGRLIIMAASFVGLLISVGIETLPHDSQIVSAMSSLIAYVLLIALVMVLDENRSINTWYMVESSFSHPVVMESYEDKCRLLATKHALTQRELDVLMLFAMGRSANYIANDLGIANSTVNYHIRHIYEKCNVRTKQDLIDLVLDVYQEQ